MCPWLPSWLKCANKALETTLVLRLLGYPGGLTDIITLRLRYREIDTPHIHTHTCRGDPEHWIWYVHWTPTQYSNQTGELPLDP